MSGSSNNDAARGSLHRALDRVSGQRAISGNAVELLTDGPAILARMADLIEQARHLVLMENYIIRSDTTGRRFAELMIAAARRGVTVLVLHDAFGCRRTKRSYWNHLRAAGVQVRAYRPPTLLHPLNSLTRDHRKYLAVDGRAAVVGGACIGDEWIGDATAGRDPWRDVGVHVAGPAVRALDATFAAMWEESGEPPPRLGDDDGSTDHAGGDVSVRVIDGVPGAQRVYRTMSLLAAAARDRVWITDAYLVAPPPLLGNVMTAADEGVDVRMLLPGRSDIPAVRDFTRMGYRDLLERGVRVWEWNGPMLHAKVVLVDDWLKVGSSNLNPSSLFGNRELDVLIKGAVAREASQQFLRDTARSVEIVLRPIRAPEAISRRLPSAVRSTEKPTRRDKAAMRIASLPRRSVLTLGQLTGGFMRSMVGAAALVSLGVGGLFLALPRLTAYVLSGVSFALAAVAAWLFVRRRWPIP